MSTQFDSIVIGSGMGGMTTAAALARMEHKVLLLEQAQTIGGLTHSFTRNGFTWDVGLHYCGDFGPDQPAGRVLEWLSDGTIDFQSVGDVYDVLHFPDDVNIAVGRPANAYRKELRAHFPDHSAEIDTYFDAIESADAALRIVAAERAIPEPFRSAHRWWNRKKIHRWCGKTTAEVIAEITGDSRLQAVLSAQWGTYGGKPTEGSFAVHAAVMAHYLDGAGYPVGGSASIADGLVPVIESAGGRTCANTPVSAILIEAGKAVGVRTSDGETFRAPAIISAIGAGETVKRLLPPDVRSQDWAVEIAELKPSICHFDLFLGFEGDITGAGATRSNHWFYESWNTDDAIWTGGPLTMMFVSFPSLKDKAHDAGPSQKHTGEALIWADWSTVARFVNADTPTGEWERYKSEVQNKLLDMFGRKFPELAPLIVYCELGTPLSTAAFTGHEKGAFYGVETTPRRILTDALSARTPVHGLYLSGQDVMSPGIAGALWGGMLGAAAVDPRVFQTFL